MIQQIGALGVIPPRANQTVLREDVNALYKERHLNAERRYPGVGWESSGADNSLLSYLRCRTFEPVSRWFG